MKKIILILFFLLVPFVAHNANALTMNTIGGITYFSDGTTASTVGGITYFSDGTTANTVGGTTYITPPYQAPQINFGWSPSLGSVRVQEQPKTNGVDMDAINRLKNLTITPTQPVYYPSYPFPSISPPTIPLSERVRQPLVQIKTCPDPTNSHLATDDRCYCNNIGHVWNKSNTACVAPSLVCASDQYVDGTQCVTYNTGCQKSYGSFSVWTKTFQNDGKFICGCSFGYRWNSSATNCIETDQGQIVSQEAALTKVNKSVSSKLKGRILLQSVPGESSSRVWYVNPRDLKRYYISSDADLLFALQHMGRFVSPAQFKKIQKNPKTVAGYFVVVTSGGGNHFVNSKDGRIYDLPNEFSGSQSLLTLKTTVGSPVTDADLRKIAVGKLE